MSRAIKGGSEKSDCYSSFAFLSLSYSASLCFSRPKHLKETVENKLFLSFSLIDVPLIFVLESDYIKNTKQW